MSYFESTKIQQADGGIANPAEDESIILLRRIVKLLESNANVDSGGRQRVAIDASPNTLAVSVNNAPNVALNAASNIIGYIMFGPSSEPILAKNAYENGIRSKLTFS